jgi:hypothetical protein
VAVSLHDVTESDEVAPIVERAERAQAARVAARTLDSRREEVDAVAANVDCGAY